MALAFNFTPAGPGLGKSISATTSSASATFSDRASIEANDVMVYNAGPSDAFMRWGSSAQTATTNDIIIPVGTVQLFRKDGASVFAAICAAGSATVYIYAGGGV